MVKKHHNERAFYDSQINNNVGEEDGISEEAAADLDMPTYDQTLEIVSNLGKLTTPALEVDPLDIQKAAEDIAARHPSLVTAVHNMPQQRFEDI